MIVKKARPIKYIYPYTPRIAKVKATPIYTNDMKKEKGKRAHRRWVTKICENLGFSDDMIANDVDFERSCPAGNDWTIFGKSKSSERCPIFWQEQSPKRC